MLSAEEAAARLASLRDPQWRAKAASRARGLPRKLRSPARTFLAPTPKGQGYAALERHWALHLEAARHLDELADDQRLSVMNALHPGLGPALAHWWVVAQSRPYQFGFDRKAFRASHAPELTVQARGTHLAGLIDLLGPFAADPVWLAAWAGYPAIADTRSSLPFRTIGALLAAAIDLGGRCGDETLATLIAVANGEHPVGLMGRHVIVALLGSSRPEGWDFVQRLLLAAQRQEGLRQAILEAADEGHPGAFDRILATVLDRKLLRFAAAIRAVGVWLGFGADVTDIPQVEARVRKLADFRSTPAERARALAGSDPWDAYLALCAEGMRDVLATIPEAQALARHPSADIRAAALRYAAATALTAGQEMLVTALDDEDVRIASLAAALIHPDRWNIPGGFEALTRLIPRLPGKARPAEALGVEPDPVVISRARAAGLLVTARGRRPVGVLLWWLPTMDATGRFRAAIEIKNEPTVTRETREVLVGLLGDRSSHVRGEAIAALSRTRLEQSEAPAVEALLTRNAADIRRGALMLLASLPPAAARASAERLAASAHEGQRAAGDELLRTLGSAATPSVPQAADGGKADGAPATSPGARAPRPAHREAIEDAGSRTVPLVPQMPKRRRRFGDEVAGQIIEALDEVAHQHRNTPVLESSWQGTREVLFGDLRWFPSPFARRRPRPGDQEEGRGMLLGEVFRGWWEARPAGLRRDDGLDALRAYAMADLATWRSRANRSDWWRINLEKLIGGPLPELRQPAAVEHVTTWLAAEHASEAVIDECLDALEASLAMVPDSMLRADLARPDGTRIDATEHAQFVYELTHLWSYSDWRSRLIGHPWRALLCGVLETRPNLLTSDQIMRWYRLMRWVEQPHPVAVPLPVDERLLIAAHEAGAASEADVIASFLHPRCRLFHDLTRHWRGQDAARRPALTAIADKVRDRLIEAELQRGDLPTPTSRTALNIASASGVTLVAELLRLLGKVPLTRGWTVGSDSRDAVFSHLIRVCFPAVGDTPGTLSAAAHDAGVPEARLVDLAVYAPQWAPLVEKALSWPGLTDGVLWLHAHTKDQQWSVDQEIRESWAAMAAERTPLTAQDLLSGAVDVRWFRAAYAALGGERWAVLHKAARHASGGNGHRRAQLFAEAMLGEVDEATLARRITAKRHQDSVRALGLLPLPRQQRARREAIDRRYGLLREFERGSRAFGSQRQASERAAVRIGIENLARTAGYADPRRFVWAVEAREAEDLADCPVTVTHGDVTLTLSVTPDGTPDLTVRRGGRVLRSVPAALRKAGNVAELRARKTTLMQQAARVREALESAMVAQDTFIADDLAELRRHPVVAPMLDQLVWVDEEGRTLCRAAAHATTADGTTVAVHSPLRLAHPADLAAEGTWVAWQERLFTDQRRQPFKQVFRELYVLTQAERKAGPASHRYDGHQLQPRQALALLGSRGWLASHESGDASRVFHDHNLVARVEFANGFLTPLEADLPTIEGVYFTHRGEHLAQSLESIHPVVFSETMRDLDLVVSVAHAGGVDPEATASTTEMRAALIRETARLMKLENISFAGDHVLIDGVLGEYSLHLGSGTVHRRPGGAVCIVPVGSQHRGRLFLPFADDDPKTAEIVSKALLLARDREIKDPTILEQLRG